MKRVFIIHGWSGYPEEGWFPWLKRELEKQGFEVLVPLMPNADVPVIKEWVGFLKKTVGNVDEDTYFVGHSIGCQAIMRYLEGLKKDVKIGGVVFVAGWFNLVGLETDEEKEIAKPWIKKKINFEKIKSHCSNITAIFSDDDYFVPLSDTKIFQEKLNAKIIIEYNKGHFSGSDNITELQIVLNELLKSS